MSRSAGLVPAAFVERPNRFVVIVELEDGRRVRAHLPNTGRLTHLMIPGMRFLLEPTTNPGRTTRFTATRAWDGCWVALQAGRAPDLLATWLRRHELPGFGPVRNLEREVTLGRHRIDLLAHTAAGAVWLEVKSGGRADGSHALLSQTPSERAARQLAALADLARAGQPAMVAFVVQRPDVDDLVVGGDADPGWIASVTAAAGAGVHVEAYGCAVTEDAVWIEQRLPLCWAD